MNNRIKQNTERSDHAQSLTQVLLETTRDCLPRMPKKPKRVAFSEETESILQQRRQAVRDRDANEFERLTKEFRKSKAKDKKACTIESLSANLDIRDRWMGIRQLRADYKPQPYHRKEADGQHIPQ